MHQKKSNLSATLMGMMFKRDAEQPIPLNGASENANALPEIRNAESLNGRTLARSFYVDDFKVDLEKRTVELSFSSEAEVERWFGIEVLSHDAGAIRFERLNSRAAFLENHKTDLQCGVVEKAWLDNSQRKGRALVRLSKSARGEEILQDIHDLIRTNISVGYLVHGAVLKEQREHDDVYLITDWEPYEISTVSVPADISVGVGRSVIQSAQHEKLQNDVPAPEGQNERIQTNTPTQVVEGVVEHTQQRADSMNWDYFTDDKGNYVRQMVNDKGERYGAIEILRAADDTAQRGSDAEHQRVRSLIELGEKYGAGALANQYITERKSPEELQTAILDQMNERQGKPLTEQKRDSNIGLSDSEINRFSLMRAVRALLPNASNADREAAAFELECSAEAQRQYGRSAQGILVPADVLSRAFEVGTPTSGGNLVGTDHRADMFVEMLRNRSTIMQLGQHMSGLVGDVDIPKQTGGATAYWLGEGEDATASDPTTSQLKLSPKTVGGRVEITRKLLQQGTPDAERLVFNDLNKVLALKIDQAGYYGTGTTNQPLGLKNISGINATTFTAANPTYAEIVNMESEIAADNADLGSMAYVFNAMMRGHLKTAPKFGTGTESVIWEAGNTVNGYRTEVTNQIATGDVFFGNFADLIIALWGGLDITVDPYSLSASGGLRIVAFQDVDFVLRNAASICYGASA
ncbi:phage major capsid protein, HK97 family [Acinetobacter marinus]|uniref:Phage major capsid protein, HK97 family n=1 Tax=Acinetobacter marinus TaxID=281375 RepID=A0A1G6JC19_9GAMM|nr:phage major capsid protein [Acinetobacter marinus]SDC16432.1 phage major capsid protein, HK97 family [Acinetobacter marinus]